MDNFSTSLFDSLRISIFQHRHGEQFTLQSPLPNWLVFFLGHREDHSEYTLTDIFPYLTCFIEDAEQHWADKQSTPLSSGTWIEIDELGNELALEANALFIDEQPVLLLQT